MTTPNLDELWAFGTPVLEQKIDPNCRIVITDLSKPLDPESEPGAGFCAAVFGARNENSPLVLIEQDFLTAQERVRLVVQALTRPIEVGLVCGRCKSPLDSTAEHDPCWLCGAALCMECFNLTPHCGHAELADRGDG